MNNLRIIILLGCITLGSFEDQKITCTATQFGIVAEFKSGGGNEILGCIDECKCENGQLFQKITTCAGKEGKLCGSNELFII